MFFIKTCKLVFHGFPTDIGQQCVMIPRIVWNMPDILWDSVLWPIVGKNCVGQRSLFTLGVYLNVYLKHLRLMSGSGHEGSSRSFPATFKRVFQAGKQSWVSAIVGALGYLEQQCPHCCLFHLAEDGLADFLWHRKQTSPNASFWTKVLVNLLLSDSPLILDCNLRILLSTVYV